MSVLSKLNPANHLSIKLFLWFWLATLLIIGASVWFTNQLRDEVRFAPIRKEQVRDVERYTERLQTFIDRRQGVVDLEPILQQLSRRFQIGLIVVDPETKTLLSGLPRHLLPAEAPFISISAETPPLALDTNFGQFMGPGLIQMDNKNYLLFIGRLGKPGPLGDMRRQHPGVLLLLAISISGILCFFFARSLLNPIRQLQLASQQMARGELGSRVGSASERHDEIGQLGRDFNHMSQQVESLLANQKRLLADISHELRSPLTRLQLSIGIMQQQVDQADAPQTRASLDRIEKEATQMEILIGRVLLLSRWDSPQVKAQREWLDLSALLSSIVSDAQFEAQGQNKQVSAQIAEAIKFKGDEQMLASAVENILRNAITYAKQHVQLIAKQNDECILLEISDDGPGIASQDINRIFDAFYRESSARERHSGGVGLGLAIAHQAIQKHQGSIHAHNQASGGLVVQISLPMA
jgi:two-component system, OmpR family, sensor histidine kinase CpxA